jgi:hypothetical protein
MLLCPDYRTAFLAQLQFKLVRLSHAASVQAGQVPFVRQLYTGLRRAVISTIATKDACVPPESDFSHRRLCLDIVYLCKRLSRADIDTRTATDAGLKVKFRLASIFFRHYARLGGETSSKTRRKNRCDRFF